MQGRTNWYVHTMHHYLGIKRNVALYATSWVDLENITFSHELSKRSQTQASLMLYDSFRVINPNGQIHRLVVTRVHEGSEEGLLNGNKVLF